MSNYLCNINSGIAISLPLNLKTKLMKLEVEVTLSELNTLIYYGIKVKIINTHSNEYGTVFFIVQMHSVEDVFLAGKVIAESCHR